MKKTILIGAALAANLLYLCGCAGDRPTSTSTTTEETTIQRPAPATTTTETETVRPGY